MAAHERPFNIVSIIDLRKNVNLAKVSTVAFKEGGREFLNRRGNLALGVGNSSVLSAEERQLFIKVHLRSGMQ